MTIGQYIALKQPNIFRKLMQIYGYRPVKLENRKKIDLLMKEIPGFYRDERLPR